MYDIDQLESQWRRYKRKRIFVPVASVVTVLVLITVGYIFWPDGSTQRSEAFDVPAQKTVADDSRKHVPVIPQTSSLATETPSVIEKDTGKKGWHMTFADSENVHNNASRQSPPKHIDIEVSAKKTEYTIQEIEKRFRFAKDKDDALLLARYYYDKKQYKKALSWALETNKLDSDIEESWLLFGRSKARLGQRMEAIRVLQAYFDRTGSKKAKVLLDKVRRGKNF
jgi:tetratricopeptide (TPR) repeat protein